jgi:ABC-2 type transport system permease protein
VTAVVPRAAAPRAARLRAQAAMELRLTLRNGEALLVTFAIPLVVLVFFGRVDVLPTDRAFLVPGVLALSVMSTSLVALGIATGFERYYLVLKRLGATPLTRGELIAAKIAAVLVIELGQTIVLLGAAALVLGYRPGEAARLWLVPLALALGTAAFAGLGLALAGSLRATATLALTNAAYVLLMLIGGVVIPLDRLPAALAAAARFLPSAALAGVYRAALGTGTARGLLDLAVLAGSAVAAVLLAVRVFRWE